MQGASCRPTVHSQSVFPVPSPSLLTTRRNHQTPSPPPSTKTVAGVTAPWGQSTEIQSRCSLALSGIVKTDNRIYTRFLNSISGFGKNPILTSLVSCYLLIFYVISLDAVFRNNVLYMKDGNSEVKRLHIRPFQTLWMMILAFIVFRLWRTTVVWLVIKPSHITDLIPR